MYCVQTKKDIKAGIGQRQLSLIVVYFTFAQFREQSSQNYKKCRCLSSGPRRCETIRCEKKSPCSLRYTLNLLVTLGIRPKTIYLGAIDAKFLAAL